MFSPSKLYLAPSYRLAAILLIPLLTPIILIISISLPNLLTAALLSAYLFTALHFVYKYVLLRHKNSLTQLEFIHGQFIGSDVSGRRFQLSPHAKQIIHPACCLLSFKCHPLDQDQDPGARNDIRHLIICRYNSLDPNAFRRLRVGLSFHHELPQVKE